MSLDWGLDYNDSQTVAHSKGILTPNKIELATEYPKQARKMRFNCNLHFLFFSLGSKKFPSFNSSIKCGSRPLFFVANLPSFVARVWKQAKSGNNLATCSVSISHIMLVEKPQKKLSQPFRTPASIGEVGSAWSKIPKGKTPESEKPCVNN